MSLPSPVAAQHLFDGLRALNRRPRSVTLAKTDSKLIDSLERRFLTALERDRTGSVVPDGYPTQTGGGGARWNGSSSTERAGVALADGDVLRDRHHELMTRAATALEDAVTSLNVLNSALASIDDLTVTTTPAPRTCAHCTGKRGSPDNDRPVHRTGTVGDRLTTAKQLCEACYSFVIQTARPGTRAGWLPDEAQIADHERRGRWRIRAA